MNENEMKLFVVGEYSGNPDDWSPYNPYRAIVVARNEEEARSLADGSNMVAEIPMASPMLLMSESAPDGL